MARSFAKYLKNPSEEIPRKIRKVRERAILNKRYIYTRFQSFFRAKQLGYSGKVIDITWEGKPKRYELVNKVIEKIGAKNYLEIGCFKDECFKEIVCENKVGVDPMSGGTLRMTSDEFFAQNNEKFDCIFIDGLHEYNQVNQDILNALDCLNDGGVIMLHDCLPTSYWQQTMPPTIIKWNGDVWKSIVRARTYAELDTVVCLIDEGVGVMVKRSNSDILKLKKEDFADLKFSDFVENYESWLRTIEFDEVLEFIERGNG
jgi:hypothetical protein